MAGLAALETSLAFVTSSLSGIGGLMSGLGGTAAAIGGALSAAVATGVAKATEAFNELTTYIDETLLPALGPFEGIVRGIGTVVKTVLVGGFDIAVAVIKGGVIPILKIAFDTLMAMGQFITGDFSGAFDTVEGTVRKNLIPLLTTISKLPGRILAAGIGLAVQGVRALITKVKDTGGKIVDSVKDTFAPVVNFITKPFLDAFATIKRAFKPVREIIGKIGGVLGKARKKVTGAREAIGDARDSAITSIGAAVQGGLNTSVNMTLSLAGMTDKSDKRMYANEIGSMIEDQVKARLGTPRSVL